MFTESGDGAGFISGNVVEIIAVGIDAVGSVVDVDIGVAGADE